MIKIVQVMKIRRYFLFALLSAIVFGFVYVYTQVLGLLHNVDIWFANIPPLNLGMFIIFSVLFGVVLSFQIYNWRQPKACDIKKPAGTTSIATGIGLLVAQCPACASLGALFLPFSVITFIGEYSLLFNLISIGLLLFTVNYLGGFKKINK